MIEQKDASKSDERQVKNTSKPNLSTQKRKGETHTMGNRGMTNWKLGAFLIIGLMLFAAAFSNTAMAAPNDGAGAVEALFTASDVTPTTVPSAVEETALTSPQADDTEVAAGSRYNILQFTYTAFDDDGTPDDISDDEGINMAGGRVRIMFPSGWGDMTKFVRVQEFMSATDTTGDNTVGVSIGEAARRDIPNRRRWRS